MGLAESGLVRATEAIRERLAQVGKGCLLIVFKRGESIGFRYQPRFGEHLRFEERPGEIRPAQVHEVRSQSSNLAPRRLAN